MQTKNNSKIWEAWPKNKKNKNYRIIKTNLKEQQIINISLQRELLNLKVETVQKQQKDHKVNLN